MRPISASAFAAPQVDIDKLRAHKDKVVGKLTGGLAGMAKGRKVEVVRGYGHFLDPHHIEVEETTAAPGQDRRQEGHQVQAVHHRRRFGCRASALHPARTRASSIRPARWNCASCRKKMLVIGGGIIGLEMATVYSTLGARVDVVEMMDGLMQGPDRDAVKVWEKQNATASTRSC
jgi:dihydrolipoamide dehydrogenase